MTTSKVEPERYQEGWRSGKPMEDPEKLKRWGFVTAKPSEYLVCVRGGQIDRRRSGQGARVFKWPWQAVAIVPTTLQRIEFTADQITRERVGVSVTGIAVYRIVEPELAFRVLNFTYGESAGEKLGATLREMFIGAARRLIANLSLDECLQRRKEAIAAFLMQEIAPVCAGRGTAADATDQGWGVVIDTIEIKDVQILSQQVFQHLQAPYRAAIASRAEAAELERQREVAERRAEAERRAAEAAAQLAHRRAQLEQERGLLQIKADEERRRAQAQAEVAALGVEAARADAHHQAELRRLEQERLQRELAQSVDQRLREAQVRQDHALRKQEAETRRLEAEVEAAQQQRLAEIEQMLNQGRALRELVTQGLPQIAQAFKQSFGTVHYTQLGGEGEGPMGMVAAAMGQVLAVARSFGLDPAQLGGQPKGGDGGR